MKMVKMVIEKRERCKENKGKSLCLLIPRTLRKVRLSLKGNTERMSPGL